MIEIENIPLENWLKPLKPYQRNTIEQLVAKYGKEKVAEEYYSKMGVKAYCATRTHFHPFP